MENNVNANKVVAKIIGRGINWFNFESMTPNLKLAYYAGAQEILRNNTFKNEFNHLVADFVQEIAKSSPSWENVLLLRAGINVMEAFRERLENIPDPEKIINRDELNSVL